VEKSIAYTLSETVERLCPTASQRETYSVQRKVQNWVTAGLVEPMGQNLSGRGIHRRFDDHEIWKIAVLLELSAYQVPVKMMKLAGGLFDDSRVEARRKARKTSRKRRTLDGLADRMDQAKSGDKPMYLKLETAPEGPVTADIGPSIDLRPRSPSAILMDIGAIWEQIS
jgi:hypothetical protein